MSVIHTRWELDELAGHLRDLLLIEADGSAYLLRFADSQMLAAVCKVLTPSQQVRFFGGVKSSFTVDHQGRLNDVADGLFVEEPLPACDLPLKLDAAQTHALLDAAAVPALVSQVRNLDATFGQQLDHAQQTEFIERCMAMAQEAGIDADLELPSWTLQQWQDEDLRSLVMDLTRGLPA